jgi:hypothetical protein
MPEQKAFDCGLNRRIAGESASVFARPWGIQN